MEAEEAVGERKKRHTRLEEGGHGRCGFPWAQHGSLGGPDLSDNIDRSNREMFLPFYM